MPYNIPTFLTKIFQVADKWMFLHFNSSFCSFKANTPPPPVSPLSLSLWLCHYLSSFRIHKFHLWNLLWSPPFRALHFSPFNSAVCLITELPLVIQNCFNPLLSELRSLWHNPCKSPFSPTILLCIYHLS